MTQFKKILVQEKPEKKINANFILETERHRQIPNPILTLPDKKNHLQSRTVSRMINYRNQDQDAMSPKENDRMTIKNLKIETKKIG